MAQSAGEGARVHIHLYKMSISFPLFLLNPSISWNLPKVTSVNFKTMCKALQLLHMILIALQVQTAFAITTPSYGVAFRRTSSKELSTASPPPVPQYWRSTLTKISTVIVPKRHDLSDTGSPPTATIIRRQQPAEPGTIHLSQTILIILIVVVGVGFGLFWLLLVICLVKRKP
jgi:hypothetical protein